jgi:hypothetical protein
MLKICIKEYTTAHNTSFFLILTGNPTWFKKQTFALIPHAWREVLNTVQQFIQIIIYT